MRTIAVLLIIGLILGLTMFSGCSNGVEQKTEKARTYEECTAVCSGMLDEDFTVVNFCNEQCLKKFNRTER